MTTRLHNYAEVRAYLEKEHPGWLRALTPRHIKGPTEILAPKSVAGLIRDRRDAELRQHP